MGQRLGRALDWCADNVGNVYLVVLTAGVLAGIATAVVVAWPVGLVALVLPAFWLLMWLTA